MNDWSTFLSAMTLALVRVSGIVLFAPFFSATAIPIRVKAIFCGTFAFLLAPIVADLPGASVSLGFSSLIGELAVGLVYGLTLALLNEMMLFAGQIAGLQFSFSLVNLLDPASNIQTPLLGELFQLMGTLVVIAAGLDRVILASLVRSFRVVPLGSYALAPTTALTIVRAAAGNRYIAPPKVVPLQSKSSAVHQGALEAANQDVVQGSLDLIVMQRQAEMMQKALTVFHTEFNKIATEDLPKV